MSLFKVKRLGIEYEVIIDEEYTDLISKHNWFLNKDGYVFCNTKENNIRKTTFLHNMIIGRKKGYEVDHINHSKLDNRRSNLRHLTRTQNIWNQRKRKDNTFGTTGIRWYAKIKKFSANIQVNKKRIHLGVFKTKEEAEEVYNLAKNKYHLINGT